MNCVVVVIIINVSVLISCNVLICCVLLFRSPGRSSVSFDNEIVMMNHVYRERFPKVRTGYL